MKNSVGIIISVVAAATAGIIIGMLTAPEKGEELRKDIKDTAGDWSKKIGNLMMDDKDKLQDPEASLGDEPNGYKYGNKKRKS